MNVVGDGPWRRYRANMFQCTGAVIPNARFAIHCARRGLDKNIVSTTAPERAVLSELSLGVALRTDESGASEAAETCIFLASI